MGNVIVDIANIYHQYFGKPYAIAKEFPTSVADGTPYVFEGSGAVMDAGMSAWWGEWKGVDVMMPIKLDSLGRELYLPCATINCSRKNTIVRTAVAERVGTVKEQFAVGDWIMRVKGVLIGERGSFPEEDAKRLIELSENREVVEIHCGLTDLFMPGNNKVVIEDIDFPAIEGKSIRHRPFTLTLESDYVESLVVERS